MWWAGWLSLAHSHLPGQYSHLWGYSGPSARGYAWSNQAACYGLALCSTCIKPVGPGCGTGFWASLDLGWLLGAQHHQAHHLAREVGWWVSMVQSCIFVWVVELTTGNMSWPSLSWLSCYTNSWARRPTVDASSWGMHPWSSTACCYCTVLAQCRPFSQAMYGDQSIQQHGIAALLLQQHPDKLRTWTPMASWGCCLEPLEKMESHILLELKALREGAWKMGEFMAFSQQLVMQVMLELHALLKVTLKVHPELQAMLIDVQQYKPTWVMGGASRHA